MGLYLIVDHSCNKYFNLIGQDEVTNSDRHLHDYEFLIDTYNFMRPTHVVSLDTKVIYKSLSSKGRCKTWTLDSGLDSWTGLWTEIWTNFWTELLMVTTISKHTFCSTSSKQG